MAEAALAQLLMIAATGRRQGSLSIGCSFGSGSDASRLRPGPLRDIRPGPVRSGLVDPRSRLRCRLGKEFRLQRAESPLPGGRPPRRADRNAGIDEAKDASSSAVP